MYYDDDLDLLNDPDIEKETEEAETIRVLLVEPGKAPRPVEIRRELSAMQEAVGGYIEVCYPYMDPVCLICNEEGKINGLEPNRSVYGEDGEILDLIFGPFFICDCSGDDFGSLSDTQIRKYSEIFADTEQTWADCFSVLYDFIHEADPDRIELDPEDLKHHAASRRDPAEQYHVSMTTENSSYYWTDMNKAAGFDMQ